MNQKEEVIQLQLTPYGRQTFASGSFSPQYFSFYDDNILYDGSAGGIVEIQNEIVDRIKGTKSIGLYTNYGLTSGSAALTHADYTSLDVPNAKFFRPLGTNSPWSDHAPAWDIVSFPPGVGFSGSVAAPMLQFRSDLAIPTLQSRLEIQYANNAEAGELPIYVRQEVDRCMLDVLEMNTIFKGNGNYDIEVFKIPDPLIKPDEMVRLKFIGEHGPDIIGLRVQQDPHIFKDALGDNEFEIRDAFPLLNENYVEYYLNLRVDTEIVERPMVKSGSPYRDGRPDDPAVICKDRDVFPLGIDKI